MPLVLKPYILKPLFPQILISKKILVENTIITPQEVNEPRLEILEDLHIKIKLELIE